MTEYSERHAKAGLKARLPALECFSNQFSDYEIELVEPEFTSVCPRTGLPDFGTIRIQYRPKKWCVELKAFKYYINGYRDVGIFQENAVNRILKDFVAAVKPVSVVVTGTFNARGGISTVVEAAYPSRQSKPKNSKTGRKR